MKSKIGKNRKAIGSKGFTLVEVLVAMSLLMLIMITFTPLFMTNFRNLRMSGEVTKATYTKASLMERLIARKGDNIAGYETSVDNVPIIMNSDGLTSVAFGPSTSAGAVHGTVIASNSIGAGNSYTTFYTTDNTSRMVCFPANLTDDFLTAEITVVPKGFKFNSKVEQDSDEAGWHFRVSYTDNSGNKQPVGKQYYDFTFVDDGDSKVAVFTFKGANNVICFENSPLHIEYGQGVGDLQYEVKVEIGAPEIIFVGEKASDDNYYYYVTSGVDTDTGRMDLIAKSMTGSMALKSAMNDVEWVEKGRGDNGNGGVNEYGYYVMGGDAGQVRRFWKEKDYVAGSHSENYCWGGDYLYNFNRYFNFNGSGTPESDSYATINYTLTDQAMFKSILRTSADIISVSGNGAPINQLFKSELYNIIGNNNYEAIARNLFTANVTNADANKYYLTLGTVQKYKSGGKWYRYYGSNVDASKDEFSDNKAWSWLTGGQTGATKLNAEGYKEATNYEYSWDNSLITITSVGAIQINKTITEGSNHKYYETTVNNPFQTGVQPKQSYTLYCGTIPAVMDIFGWKTKAVGGYTKFGHAATIGAAYSTYKKSWYPIGKFGQLDLPATGLSTAVFGTNPNYTTLLNYIPSDNTSLYPDTSGKIYKAGEYSGSYLIPGIALPTQGHEQSGAMMTSGLEVDVTMGYLSHPYAVALTPPAAVTISGTSHSDYYLKNKTGLSGDYSHSGFSAGLRDNLTFLDVKSFHDDINDNNISFAVGYTVSFLFNDWYYFNHMHQVYNCGIVYIRSTGAGDENDTAGDLSSGKGWSMKQETNLFHEFFGTDQYRGNNISPKDGTVAVLGWDTDFHRAYFNVSVGSGTQGTIIVKYKNDQPGTSDAHEPKRGPSNYGSQYGTNCHPLQLTECTTVNTGLTWDAKPQVMWGTKNGTLMSWFYDYENLSGSKIPSVKKEFESYMWAQRMGAATPLKNDSNRNQYYDYTSVNDGTSGTYGFVSTLESINDVAFGDDYWVAVGAQSGKNPAEYCASNNCYTGNGYGGSYINVKYCYSEESHKYAWKAVRVDNQSNIDFVSITYCQGVWYLLGYFDNDGDHENDANENAVIYYSTDPSDGLSWHRCKTQVADGSYNSTGATALYYDSAGKKKEITVKGLNSMASQG